MYSFELCGTSFGLICLKGCPYVVAEFEPEELSTKMHLVQWRVTSVEYVPEVVCRQKAGLPVEYAVQREDRVCIGGHGHAGLVSVADQRGDKMLDDAAVRCWHTEDAPSAHM